MFSLYTNWAGYLSVISKDIFVNLLGVGAFTLPIYMIYVIIKLNFLKEKKILNAKFVGVTIVVITTMLLVQLLDMKSIDTNNFMNAISNIINSQNEITGGIIGFIIVFPIYKLVGSIGLYIIFIIAYFIASVLIFDYSINDLKKLFKLLINNKTNVRNSISKKGRSDSKKIKIKVNNEESEKEEFLKNIESKIKILDFMKNTPKSSIELEEKSEIKINTDSRENADIKVQHHKLDDKFKTQKIKKIEGNSPIRGNEDVISKTQEIQSKTYQNKKYVRPNADLLNINTNLKLDKNEKKELLENADKLEKTLLSFGVEAKILEVTKGPSVTRFELQPKAGIKVSKIVNLSDDIALGLAAKGVRIEAPIPGKSAIGIEVPNKEQTPVFFREILESNEFKNNNYKVACALGKDITGKCIVTDISKMPHVLIAGATGSGKSVCINTLIVSILYKYSPEDVKLLMVDPKVVELNVYNGIPHLLIPVVTDPKKAAAALNWAVNEMTRRYKLFADNGVRNVDSYNELVKKGVVEEKLPYIVIIIDELADLMMACPRDVEDYICRLAQMARAAGMHLVIATQRPSVDVITGLIKANVPSRISFAVSSQVDSRTILDSTGAEKLLGKGDMLFYPVGESKPKRVQGAFISEEEVENVVSFIKDIKSDSKCESEILEYINSASDTSIKSNEDCDELLDEAIKIVVETGQVSTSYLQRRLRIGFNRAARIVEELEKNRIISARDGNKPRQVLMSKEEFENIK
ncbi:MAG: DNA translocase FtsK [Sarcina ventriculi]|nr:DNA translocase FtsK [Sarcina ventriculi]MBU5321764.1 DNA translocase FtsK [Sarcina ventriculi]MCI5636708.1 DNA translocase FtsK [Sarcina ventriculi]MDD7373057.1 DNA translocase FtsK [Sarcina ventriculi]MDY7063244.1 DNA translocase FtsK [Sarcina ventriculi]